MVTSIRAFEPLIVGVTLTNRDSTPLQLHVRDDGLPDRLASVVTHPDGAIFRHHQWVTPQETAPGSHEELLAPGDSTTGEVVILFGGPPTGVAFPVPGTYTVQCACQPDGRFAPVMSNEVRVTVEKITNEETSFFSELRALSLSYYGLNEDYMVEREGEYVREYEFGLKLVRRLLRHTKPILIDPERNSRDKKAAELVKSLEAMLERHPDSAYSGYIARYVGLVYLKTLEHEGSLEGWGERDPQRVRAHPAYAKALRYLTMAKDANVWPRTAALENLVMLHGLAQEWGKAKAYIATLREQCAGIGGGPIADQLEAQMKEFRAKMESHRAEQASEP
jgi:hypothetical protein